MKLNFIFPKGFTVLEIVVSISLFILIIILSGSMYILSQRSYNKGSGQGELAQNARVSLDRISRELRQSVDLVTNLPPTDTDPGNPPSEEIFFQDGHDISQITYLRYFLEGTNLKRRFVAYYFDTSPDDYVFFNSLDQSNNPPQEKIIEDRVVGEYFNGLNFWGVGGLIYISFDLVKDNENIEIRTSIFSRN